MINEYLKVVSISHYLNFATWFALVCVESVASYETSNSLHTTLIYNGVSGTISCPFHNATTDNLKNVQYHWVYKGDQKYTTAIQNPKTGQLQVASAKPQDTGLYTCKLKGTAINTTVKDGQGKKPIVSLEFQHKIIVYELPDVLVTYYTFFKVPKCLKTIDRQTMDRYMEVLCRDLAENCPYSITYRCIPSKIKQTVSEAMDNPKDKLKIVIQIESPRFTPPTCDAKCVRQSYDIRVKVLQIRIKTKWRYLFQEDRERMRWYKHSSKPERLRVEEGCPPGYAYFRRSVCIACEPGFYWDDRLKKCRGCPLNTYSANGGATMCQSCPDRGFTNTTRTTSEKSCKVKKINPNDCSNTIMMATGIICTLILLNMGCSIMFRPTGRPPPGPAPGAPYRGGPGSPRPAPAKAPPGKPPPKPAPKPGAKPPAKPPPKPPPRKIPSKTAKK